MLANEWMALDKLKSANYSQITYEQGRVFYRKTLGGENVGKLYYRDGWNGAEQLLFDPAGFKPTGSKADDVATIVSYTPSPDGRHVVLGLSAAGAEYSELRPIEVESRKLLPETIYPSYGALSWTMDSKSFLYDAGKVTDIKNPEIELNRKTRLHALGTEVASDADFFSNESYADLEISPKELPMAFIDESYPDYVIGNVGTVQNEMRLFYAPTSQMTPGNKLKWSVLALPSDNLVRGHGVPQGPCLRDYAYGCAEVQDRPHVHGAPRLENSGNGRAGSQGLDPVHHSQQELHVRRLLERDRRQAGEIYARHRHHIGSQAAGLGHDRHQLS